MSTPLDTAYDKMKGVIDARIASYFSSCVHCGICAEACHFYAETGDPKYTPIYKLEPMRKVWRQEHTFWGKFAVKLGWREPLTENDLKEWQELVYDSCTLCGRCSMVCPVGNDIAYMIRKEREGMSASGYSPEGLQGAAQRAIEIGSPMGITWTAVSAQIKHAEKALGFEIPVDKEGVEYLALLSSLEIMGFPEYIEAIARIFRAADVSWTFSSQCFEATNAGIQLGDSKVAAELVGRIVSAAEALKVKQVISPECGHAYTAIRWEGPNLIGRELPFRVVHILEVLDELRASGKLDVEGTIDERLTWHDPCSIVRKGGVVDQPRNLLGLVATDFVEGKDRGVMNWCCGGGGGVSANEDAEALRHLAFRKKKRQFEDLGVSKVVTACANCRNTLEDGLEHYEMDQDIEVVGIAELLAEHLKSQGAEKSDAGTPGA